ncbi:hypothetical protein pEaSNUABM52_00278 [Erwinia phage pEp_SNUABM_52]|nr:hypothetical protein pEaSNUABM52_00278 [Erwinia phage pEp_SNUABM_52]
MYSVYYTAYHTWRKRFSIVVLLLVLTLIAQGYMSQTMANSYWMWIGILYIIPLAVSWYYMAFYSDCLISDLQAGTHVVCPGYDKWKKRHIAWYTKRFGSAPRIKQMGDNN